MLKYIVKRILFMIPLMLGITIICFFVMHLAPGSPTDLQTEMNPKASLEMKKNLRALYELDKPIHIQYWSWLKKISRGDLGTSFSTDHRPVSAKIMERFPITILINFLSLIIIIAVAVPIGVLSAVHQDSLFDKVTAVFVFIGFAVPTFWLALLLMIFFGINLGWLPISGLHSLNYEYLGVIDRFIDLAKHLVLPVFVSAFGGLAGLSRYMRANMLEVIRQDYIMTARAKGLSERDVIYRHALRNALLPAITILGLSIPGLIGGSCYFRNNFCYSRHGTAFLYGGYGQRLSDSYGHFADRRDFYTFGQFNCRCFLCCGGPAHPHISE